MKSIINPTHPEKKATLDIMNTVMRDVVFLYGIESVFLIIVLPNFMAIIADKHELLGQPVVPNGIDLVPEQLGDAVLFQDVGEFPGKTRVLAKKGLLGREIAMIDAGGAKVRMAPEGLNKLGKIHRDRLHGLCSRSRVIFASKLLLQSLGDHFLIGFGYHLLLFL